MSEKALRVQMFGGFSMYYGEESVALNKIGSAKSIRLLDSGKMSDILTKMLAIFVGKKNTKKSSNFSKKLCTYSKLCVIIIP